MKSLRLFGRLFVALSDRIRRPRYSRRQGTGVRGTGIVFTKGYDQVAPGTALFQPGDGVRLWLQSWRGHPVVPGSGAARSEMRDGALGDRAGERAAYQLSAGPAGGGRARLEGIDSSRRNTPSKASPVERALIEALGKRYANPQPEDRKPLDEAYANAMREVWKAHPTDPDVGVLFAEAMMDLRPWDQWTPGRRSRTRARMKSWRRSMRSSN